VKYRIHSHRFGRAIADEEGFRQEWREIIETIESISDLEIQNTHVANNPERKSISKAINHLLYNKLKAKGWNPESAIFNDPNYTATKWRLDFAKELISVEVAFNHAGVIAWNLLKPVLASELNHVDKEIQTQLGVIIMATEDMKIAGGFDSAVGSFENAIRHLKPLQNQLSCPLVIIGLEPPDSFRVEHIGKPKRARFINL